MKAFVVNCGSSSIKYQLFSMTNETVLAKGLVERVGSADAGLKHTVGERAWDSRIDAPDHTAGMRAILQALVDDKTGVLESVDEIQAVGHRVVHGGEQVNQPCLIDERVLGIIRENFELSPLHNPANLMGIEAAREAMPSTPNVAVFDTAFLATLPPRAHRYAVPEQWYREYHVRKYGFHGTSHRYVTLRTAGLLGKRVEDVNLITAHLGNGCSMTAVAGGRAIEHTMGMTPLEGLVMGTRCGDLDPAVVLLLASKGMSGEQIDRALNKESGLLGVSGRSNDMRDLLAAMDEGDERAALAVDMFVYRIVKYVGAYYAILPSVDAVVLTGGIGENSLPVRRRICEGLARLGAKFDPDRNERFRGGHNGAITRDDSSLPVWIVSTNEELMIARETRAVVEGRS